MDDYKYMSGAGNTFYIGTDLHINSDIEVISYVADSTIEIDGVISVSINKEKNDIFALKVSGDSMIDAGIFDKDLVVIEKTTNYINNDIVAAMINNEATVKFYKKIDNKPYLIPANKQYKKIKVTSEHHIIGKVVCLFRDI